MWSNLLFRAHGLLLLTCLIAEQSRAQGPTVLGGSLSPAPNAVAAPRTTAITIPFSQAIDPATAGSIQVYGGQYRGRRPVVASTSGSTVTLTAPVGQAAGFGPGETVQVTVPATVRSAAGLGATPYVYQFTAAVMGGTGIFGAGSEVTVGSYPLYPQLADLDNDGDLDVLVYNNNNRTVSLRFNDGGGRFSGSTNLAVTSQYFNLADVDGDGDLDLLFPDAGRAVQLYRNDGTGTFAAPQLIPMGVRVGLVYTGDIDGDGNLDLAVLSDSTSLRFNDGAGGFRSPQYLPVGPQLGAGLAKSGLVDFDSDGDLDILNSYNLRRNDGTGNFGPSEPNPIPFGLRIVDDVNGDGYFDLIDRTATTFLLSNGANGFSPAPPPPVQPWCLGDIDGDGDLDIVEVRGPVVTTAFNDGRGTFSLGTSALLGSQLSGAGTLGDVDGDGDLDLVISNTGVNCSRCPPAGTTLSVRLNGGPLATQAPRPAAALQLAPNPVASGQAVRVALAGSSSARAELVNMLGQTVARALLPVQAGQAQGELPMAGLPAGVYVVRVQAGAQVLSQRLVLR